MPIGITCPDCSVSYKVPDNVAGKKIRCPKCKVAVVRVPAGAEEASHSVTDNQGSASARSSTTIASSAQKKETATVAKESSTAQQWQVKTESGDVYGPVKKSELDLWVNEGRVSLQSQLLLAGDKQWQWASDVYPELKTQTAGAGHAAATTAGAAIAGGQGGFQQAAHQGAAQQGFANPIASSGQPFQQQQYVQPQPQQVRVVTNQKSKLVAGLLGLFLGTWGIHNFYLGNIGVGVTQLILTLTCFGGMISGPWALIESIMILTGSINRDAEGRPLTD